MNPGLVEIGRERYDELLERWRWSEPLLDDRPIDMDFAKNLGLVEESHFQNCREFQIAGITRLIAGATNGPKCWNFWLRYGHKNSEVIENPTRGQLCILCLALDIDLKEEGAQT